MTFSLLDSLVDAKGDPSANYLKGNGRTVGRIRRVSYREPTPQVPKSSFRIDIEILKSSTQEHRDEIGLTGTFR